MGLHARLAFVKTGVFAFACVETWRASCGCGGGGLWGCLWVRVMWVFSGYCMLSFGITSSKKNESST